MRSINKVILIGNLTRDPEIRTTGNNQNVVTFGIATNREWVTRDGRKQNLTEYHDLVAWANLADICAKYLKKGKLVYIEGYLKTRSWDTPEGIKRFKTEIVVQDMIMLDKRQSESGGEYIPSEEGGSGHFSETREDRPEPKPRKQPKAESVISETAAAEPEKKEKNADAGEAIAAMSAGSSTAAGSIDIDQDLGL